MWHISEIFVEISGNGTFKYTRMLAVKNEPATIRLHELTEDFDRF
jgi:hypothetical protein